MANTKVTTGVIKDDAVGADQLAPNAVVTASMVDNAVTTAKIANDAILTAKISDNAVNNAKLSSNSVDSDQYVDGSIDTAHIADSQITSAKLDTNIAVGGTLTVGSHLNMGDGDILKIGAGSDLALKHTGSNSIIHNTTGQLRIRADDLAIQSYTNENSYINAVESGAVTLYYSNAAKLATATGGVTVTGTLTADDLEIDSGTLSVDASNNRVGIGTTSPAYKVDILATNQVALRLNTTDADGCFLAIQTNGTAKGYLGSSHHLVFGTPSENDITLRAENNLQFTTGGGAERARIDSSGNLLVGKTGTNTIATVGHDFGVSGYAMHSRNSSTVFYLNRNTSDGNIAEFYKDGTVVGSIGTLNSDLTIGSGDTGLRFNSANDFILPFNTTTNASRDAAIDLGLSTTRFKDLYLSGNSYANTYRHDGDSDTYLNFPAANQLSLVGGGATLFKAYQIAGAYGVLEAHGSGSATYPNFTFNGDSNTGMYRAATDTLAFTTAGSERLRIDSSGNIIIASTGGTLQTATAGTSNFRAGVNAGNSIASGGNYNTVVGDNAGTAITTGDENIAIGFNSLLTEDTGKFSVAIGVGALQTQNNDGNNYNTAVGHEAGKLVTTGTQNTLIGGLAGDALTTSSRNVALGYAALSNESLGQYSTAIGYLALGSQTSTSNAATYNTAVGYAAGAVINTGVQNTLIGGLAGDAITTGDSNSCMGVEAGGSVTTGGSNTFCGHRAGNYHQAGLKLTTGSRGTFLGMITKPSSLSVNDEVIIGYGGAGKGTNTGMLAPTSGVYQGNNSSSWSTTSDRRIKKNIKDNNIGLNAIKDIRVRNFEYRTEDEITDFENPVSAVVNKEGIQLGVIAQEIETILPNLVREESTGVKTVNPDNLTWYLVNAVKELSKQVDELKAEIQELKE